MPEYLALIEIKRVYEVYVTAPDDTAIFEYQEKPYRLDGNNKNRIEYPADYGHLIESETTILEIIEGK